MSLPDDLLTRNGSGATADAFLRAATTVCSLEQELLRTKAMASSARGDGIGSLRLLLAPS
jgi:hypothetical protein